MSQKEMKAYAERGERKVAYNRFSSRFDALVLAGTSRFFFHFLPTNRKK